MRAVGLMLTADDKARAVACIKSRDAYKAGFWRLALKLGRLPTTRDADYWALEELVPGRGES